jgi:hypothetical protein
VHIFGVRVFEYSILTITPYIASHFNDHEAVGIWGATIDTNRIILQMYRLLKQEMTHFPRVDWGLRIRLNLINSSDFALYTKGSLRGIPSHPIERERASSFSTGSEGRKEMRPRKAHSSVDIHCVLCVEGRACFSPFPCGAVPVCRI